MTFVEYVRQSSRLREEMADRRPSLFLLLEIGRHAAVMALVLAVMEVTPLSLHADAPGRRIWFIGIWSTFMAVWGLWRHRAMRKKPDKSSQSVI